ncbi:trigger factor [bacterium]|nr:trigger factor [bacterium]
MGTLIKKISNSEIEITEEIPAERFSSYYREAVKELGKELRIKGFRKGHIPPEIIEKEIGQTRILNYAAQNAISDYYIKAVKENSLDVIERPKIEILKLAPSDSLIFRAKVKILPEIELPDYKKIASSFQEEKIVVGEEEVQQTIDWLRRSRSKLIALGREAKKGDFVEIEYWSSQIEGGRKMKDGFILGKGGFIPGFEEKIEGMKAGQETEEFILKIPQKHFLKELAGKEVAFKIKLKGVFRMELPKLTDSFAKSLGNFQNIEALKKSIREGIVLEKKSKAREKLREKILEKIVESIKWDIPSILIEAERDRLFADFQKRVSDGSKVSFEEYLKKIGKTEEEIKKDLLKPAQRNVKMSLVLRAIAKRENINVSQEEIEMQINEILKRYPNLESAKSLDLERLKEYTKERISNEKTFRLLEEYVKKNTIKDY